MEKKPRKNVTRAEVIPMLVELFGVTDDKTIIDKSEEKSYYYVKDDNTASFHIDKRKMWRDDVIQTLVDFFNNGPEEIYITDGQCKIENFTLLWTTFYIEPVKE